MILFEDVKVGEKVFILFPKNTYNIREGVVAEKETNGCKVLLPTGEIVPYDPTESFSTSIEEIDNIVEYYKSLDLGYVKDWAEIIERIINNAVKDPDMYASVDSMILEGTIRTICKLRKKLNMPVEFKLTLK